MDFHLLLKNFVINVLKISQIKQKNEQQIDLTLLQNSHSKGSRGTGHFACHLQRLLNGISRQSQKQQANKNSSFS